MQIFPELSEKGEGASACTLTRSSLRELSKYLMKPRERCGASPSARSEWIWILVSSKDGRENVLTFYEFKNSKLVEFKMVQLLPFQNLSAKTILNWNPRCWIHRNVGKFDSTFRLSFKSNPSLCSNYSILSLRCLIKIRSLLLHYSAVHGYDV